MILLSDLPRRPGEADVTEQQRPAGPEDPADETGFSPPEEANEAEAIEQHQDAPFDDDGRDG